MRASSRNISVGVVAAELRQHALDDHLLAESLGAGEVGHEELRHAPHRQALFEHEPAEPDWFSSPRRGRRHALAQVETDRV
jgi:hypothetical protein